MAFKIGLFIVINVFICLNTIFIKNININTNINSLKIFKIPFSPICIFKLFKVHKNVIDEEKLMYDYAYTYLINS